MSRAAEFDDGAMPPDLSQDAQHALSYWNGASQKSFARRSGVQVRAVAEHMGRVRGLRTMPVNAAKAGMRELLAKGHIEPGDGKGMYRPTR